MTKVTIYKSPDGFYEGLEADGHAEAGAPGQDIVCAAVSMLTINTINSIDQFTEDEVRVTQDQKKGLISCSFSGSGGKKISHDAEVLMRSYEMGISELAKQYKEVKLVIKTRGD